MALTLKSLRKERTDVSANPESFAKEEALDSKDLKNKLPALVKFSQWTQRHNSCAEFLHFSYNTLQPGEELLRFCSNMPSVFLLHSYMSNFRQNPFVLEDD
jgi:hypothetical protein